MSAVKRVWAWGALASIVVAGAGCGAWWWWRHPGQDLTDWRAGHPPASWASRQRQEARWREEGVSRATDHDYVPLGQIALDLQLAVLVSEDINYFGHGPVDFRALGEVLREWWQGRRLRGGSTISQQLARTLFLSNERSLLRKLYEWRLASSLERGLGKRRILELYLNVAEFGPGLFGAEAAAQRYFGCRASALTTEQAAGLAAAIPSPGRDNPATSSDRWQSRRATILARMPRATWLRARLAGLLSQEVDPS